MTDARRNINPHKLRFKITGGIDDIKDIESVIREDRESNGWEVNWYNLKPRGDHGPLHDLELGFIETLR